MKNGGEVAEFRFRHELIAKVPARRSRRYPLSRSSTREDSARLWAPCKWPIRRKMNQPCFHRILADVIDLLNELALIPDPVIKEICLPFQWAMSRPISFEGPHAIFHPMLMGKR